MAGTLDADAAANGVREVDFVLFSEGMYQDFVAAAEATAGLRLVPAVEEEEAEAAPDQ